MGQFVYFVPGPRRPLAECGLSHAFEVGPASAEADGPGGAGVMYSAEAEAIRYDPVWQETETQDWVEREDGVWVGVSQLAHPTPADLFRSRQMPGEAMLLDDGQAWIVPRLRVYLSECGFAVAMPQRKRRTKQGWIPQEILPEWQAADAVAEELLDRMVRVHASDTESSPDIARTLTVGDGLRLVSKVLRINYRVDEYELGLLGSLASNDRLVAVLRSAIDYDTAEADVLGKHPAPAS